MMRDNKVVAYSDLPDPPVLRTGPRTNRWQYFFEACVANPGKWMQTPWPVNTPAQAAATASDIRHGKAKKLSKCLDEFAKLGTFEASWVRDEGGFGIEQIYIRVKFTPNKKRKAKK